MSSGELFGWTQNAGMGWNPAQLIRRQFLILSTQGGVRAPDGSPLSEALVALGFDEGVTREGAALTLPAQL